MAKKRSVGLVVLTNIPTMGVVAVLQRRGKFNHERLAPESRPGGVQATCHGRAEGEEDDFRALKRELDEEIGYQAWEFLQLDMPEGLKSLTLLIENQAEQEDAVTYGIFVPPNFLREVRLNASTGGLELVTQGQLSSIQDLTIFDKETGVTDTTIIAMFPDEITALHLAFEKLVPEEE